MELPSLPTDNLYKFIALSGIALVIVSMLPFFHRYKLQVEIIRLEGDIDVLKRQSEWMIADMNKLEKESDTLLKESVTLTDKIYNLKDRADKFKDTQASDKDSVVNAGETSSGIRKELLTEAKDQVKERKDQTKKVLEIQERLLEIVTIYRKIEIENANIKAKNIEHKYLKRMINMESTVGGTGFVNGLFLAIIGFTLWYKRLQVPQDRMLQMNAEGKNIRRSSDGSNK